MSIGNERFMVVAFTEHQPDRREFSVWPQHMTIVPWLQGHRLQATTRITDAVTDFGAFEVVVGAEEQFGEGGVPVWILEANAAIKGLHAAVLGAATKYGTELEDVTYTGDAYRPHITKKAGQSTLHLGQTITVNEISVIGKRSNAKLIFKNIVL